MLSCWEQLEAIEAADRGREWMFLAIEQSRTLGFCVRKGRRRREKKKRKTRRQGGGTKEEDEAGEKKKKKQRRSPLFF